MIFQQLRSGVIWLSSLPTTCYQFPFFWITHCFYCYLRKWHIYRTAKMPFRGKLTKMLLNIRFSSFSYLFWFIPLLFFVFSRCYFLFIIITLFLFFLYDTWKKWLVVKMKNAWGINEKIKCNCKIGCQVSTASILYIHTWYLTTFNWKVVKPKFYILIMVGKLSSQNF